MKTEALEIRWTVSKARNTYGYNVCSLYVNDRKVASCNGGGYDMESTCLGDYIAKAHACHLLKLKQEFYGLTFHDPNYNPGNAVVEGETIEQRERAGKSLGLERYQDFYSASSKLPTKTHTVPLIDGACGNNSVEQIINAIGLRLEWLPISRNFKNRTFYLLHDKKKRE